MNIIEYQLHYSELVKKGIKIQEGSITPIDPDPDYCKDCNAPDSFLDVERRLQDNSN